MNENKCGMIINDKIIRKNKQLKKLRKASLKMYGKAPKGVIKNKFGKVSGCESAALVQRELPQIEAEITKELLIEKCKEANLTGMSGNGFPIYKKLESFVRSNMQSKTILINGAECEPGLIHDQWLIENRLEEILVGAEGLRKVFGAQSVTIAAKNFPKSPATLPKGINLCKVPPLYPMGEERILIHQVLGITINHQALPIEQGILVMNVQSLLQIVKILSGQSANGRFVTLSDLDTGSAFAVYVEYHESIKEKLVHLFGERKHYKCGFGVMNASDVTDDMRFDPTVCFATVTSVVADTCTTNRCKGCGKCKKVCPMGLDVKKIISKMEKQKTAELAELGVNRCIGCASCSFVCAANKNPHELIGEYNAKIKG